jgi:hypothetical protein
MMDTMTLGRAFLFLTLLLATGCSGDPAPATTPTGPTTLSTASAIFGGTVSPGGSQTFSFNVNSPAQTLITFGSLRQSGGSNTTLSTPMKLLLGSPNSSDPTGCSGSTSQTGPPALVAQISQSLIVGTYCVVLSDPGNLSSGADFGIRVTQSTGISALGTPGTDTFSTNLYPGGVTDKTFGVTAQGTVTVTLTDVRPGANIGFGVGLSADQASCNLYQSVNSGTTKSVTVTAEAGIYCVRAFDPGGLPDRVTFTIQTIHP